MAPVQPIQRWLRTSDGRLPRFVRLLRRTQARLAAKRQSGSITAYMEAIVVEANATPGRPGTSA